MDGVSRPLSYQWDAGGRRTRVAHPDGYFSTYAYDPAGRLTGVYHANGALLQAFAYDVVGRLSGTARAVGNGTVYRYDGLSRPDALTHDLPGASADLALGFTYNPAGQIASRTQSNDAYAWTGHYAVNRAYTTNGLNQYTAAGTATFAYDANGNMTSDGSTSFTYDVENRLVAASGAHTAALRYDPLGRLYEVTPSTGSGGSGASGTTRFLYDGDALVAEYDAAGVRQQLYVHAGGADTPFIWYTPADIRFLHTDQQGSIIAVSSLLNNSVVGVNSYDEYGIPAAGPPHRPLGPPQTASRTAALGLAGRIGSGRRSAGGIKALRTRRPSESVPRTSIGVAVPAAQSISSVPVAVLMSSAPGVATMPRTRTRTRRSPAGWTLAGS
ncbi:MAG: hypothetical protein QOD42_1987, partial [Sphingomonadales bacterium]|nr:hypothetical protein [Sphingomonadales bacterium]